MPLLTIKKRGLFENHILHHRRKVYVFLNFYHPLRWRHRGTESFPCVPWLAMFASCYSIRREGFAGSTIPALQKWCLENLRLLCFLAAKFLAPFASLREPSGSLNP